MSDGSQDGDAPSKANRTLMGVAPPRLESSAGSPLRSPVLVRSGTALTDVAPVEPPRAEPSIPPVQGPARASDPRQLSRATDQSRERVGGLGSRALEFTRGHPALWMVLAPPLLAVLSIAVLHAIFRGHPATRTPSAATTNTPVAPGSVDPAATANGANANVRSLSELEGKPPESLLSRELLLLAAERADQQSRSANMLYQKLEANPALAQDSAVQSELFRLAGDPRTAPDALAAMASLEPPLGADLLYEVWTKTTVRTDATELARTLLYSTDVRPKASPALSVALDLRVADRCEQYQAILPKALKDGDRRSLHLLTKLNGKRGCGPKKNDDCYACLRKPSDELAATISAVKTRRAPSYVAP